MSTQMEIGFLFVVEICNNGFFLRLQLKRNFIWCQIYTKFKTHSSNVIRLRREKEAINWRLFEMTSSFSLHNTKTSIVLTVQKRIKNHWSYCRHNDSNGIQMPRQSNVEHISVVLVFWYIFVCQRYFVGVYVYHATDYLFYRLTFVRQYATYMHTQWKLRIWMQMSMLVESPLNAPNAPNN